MTNYATGHKAEQLAADYLVSIGYKIVAINWRTRRCEVDVIASRTTGHVRRRTAIYFVEVKYRRTTHQGTGVDYITPKKLSQMRYAAEMWVAQHHWTGDYELAALEISGETYAVTGFIPSLTT